MAWLRKALKYGSVRVCAQTAATTSASTPTFNIASAEASFAASAAVSELTAGLGFLFDGLGGDDDTASDQLQYHLEQLCAEAEKYPGSSLMGVAGGEGARAKWPRSLSPGTCEMLKVVCQCAMMVYDQNQRIGGSKGFGIEPVLHRTASSMGTVKASSMWKIPFTPIPGWTGKSLVVSIRGSATIVDHMVNLTGKSKDVGGLFVSFFRRPPNTRSLTTIALLAVERRREKYQCTCGFYLLYTRASLPAITEDIIQQLNADSNIDNIIFTGHSAGGAVASLVFLHFAFHNSLPTRLAKTKMSLITFGSAPTTSSSITSLCKLRPNVNLTLSTVNEYGMISRADPPYLRSLVNLYRSRNGLSPISVSDDKTEPDTPQDTAEKDVWSLPLQRYHLVGDIIILQLELTDIPSIHDDQASPRASTITSSVVNAIEITPDEFSRLLFCDVGTHRRVAYLKRLETLVAQECGSMLIWRTEADGTPKRDPSNPERSRVQRKKG